MKATKKIVGAACALVAAVALSAGSTFAWFTNNGTVTATGLEVDVQTDNSYLIIADTTGNLSKGDKTLSLSGLGKVTVEGGQQVVKLKPSAYKEATYTGDGENKTVTITDKSKEAANETDRGTTSVVTESLWYTAQGTDSDNGKIEVDESGNVVKTNLTADNFDEYVVVADMVISVSVGSTAVEHVYAKMSAEVAEDTKYCPIRVVFLYQVVAANTEGSTPTWGTLGDWTKLDVLATAGLGTQTGVDIGGIADSNTYIAVKAMVYMDGNDDEHVKTTNSANLKGVKLNFEFKNEQFPSA